MKISIITTVYKAEKDLPRLLDSMMAQKSPELEFFLIDNGSPDRCGEICREYAAKDSRFAVFTLKENIGYIRARNLGIQECSGDYIGFCDSDDYLEPGGYDRAVERIKQTVCDLYATAWRTISDTDTENLLPFPVGVYTGEDILPQAFGPIAGKGMLHGFAWKHIYRRSIVLNKEITFMEPLKPYEDQIFNIDMLRHSECVCIDDSIIYNYIVNPASITAQMTAQFDAEAEWWRISALYEQKCQRVLMPVHKEALCNQTLQSVYTMAVNMVKSSNYTMPQAVKAFCKWQHSGLIADVAKNASEKQSTRLQFVKWCLKHRQYRLMLSVMTAAKKIGKG